MKSIINDNRTYSDVSHVCELFNDHFTSVNSRIHKTFPPPSSEDEFSYYTEIC